MNVLITLAGIVEMEVVVLLAICILGFATTLYKEWK